MEIITRNVVKKLFVPVPSSHKGQNGVLLVIGGSGKYHGAPLLAIKAASRFVDLVYFYSPAKLNHAVLAKMKSSSNCLISLPKKDVFSVAAKCDCILIGNGLELNARNKRLVNALLRKFPHKKIVLDAAALHLADAN